MCKSILKGQNVPGTDGTYHGTDGTCPRDRRDAHQGCPTKILYVYWFFSFPSDFFGAHKNITDLKTENWERTKGAAKASCAETVVQKGVFGESVSTLPP